jgi:hypothetical protein
MSGSSSPNAWAEALDAVEAHLGLVERFLAGEAVDPQPYQKTSGLGPLPSEELHRAATLRSATTEMEERLAVVQTALGDSQPAA